MVNNSILCFHHIFNPDGVHRSIKHEPFFRRRRVLNQLPHVTSQNAVRPFMRVLIKVSIQLPHRYRFRIQTSNPNLQGEEEAKVRRKSFITKPTVQYNSIYGMTTSFKGCYNLSSFASTPTKHNFSLWAEIPHRRRTPTRSYFSEPSLESRDMAPARAR